MIDEVYDVVRSGATLVNSETQKWLTARDVTRRTIIFIHGFTSHGKYMASLVDYVNAHGFATALFNYDSYRGIDVGTTDLRALLEVVSVPLQRHGYALVAHSMGGLIALQYALGGSMAAWPGLKGVVTLGVPSVGTLRDKRLVSYILDWAEWLTGPNPYARNLGSRAAMQLTGNDSEGFLASLAQKLKENTISVPFLSVSGGMNFLEFGKGPLTGVVRNGMLQRLIGDLPNDGLVPESSANLLRVPALKAVTHRNDYGDYARINHTFLTRNQQIGNLITVWLSTNAFPEPALHTEIPL